MLRRRSFGPRVPIRAIALKRGGATRSTMGLLDAIAKALCKLKAGGFRMDDAPTMWVGPCQKCGRHATLQWAHYIGRRCHRTRWEPDNTYALCGGCHQAFDQKVSAIPMGAWVISQIGTEREQRLRDRLNASFRIDYEATLVALKSEWAARTGTEWA